MDDDMNEEESKFLEELEKTGMFLIGAIIELNIKIDSSPNFISLQPDQLPSIVAHSLMMRSKANRLQEVANNKGIELEYKRLGDHIELLLEKLEKSVSKIHDSLYPDWIPDE